ncbi:MAG: hypothetical protein IH876_16930 [Gemmatimonadetes bacterium]|nr:hypothetical protein [Gemmatimonadota bacterium]
MDTFRTLAAGSLTGFAALLGVPTAAQTIQGEVSVPSAFFEYWPAVNQTVRLVALRDLHRVAYDLCREHDAYYLDLAELWHRIYRERTSGAYTTLGLRQLAAEEQEVVDSLIALFEDTGDGMFEILMALTVDEVSAGVAARYSFEGVPPGNYAMWAEAVIADLPYQWWVEFSMPRAGTVTLDLNETVFAEAALPFSCDRLGFGEWRKDLAPLPERRWALPSRPERQPR